MPIRLPPGSKIRRAPAAQKFDVVFLNYLHSPGTDVFRFHDRSSCYCSGGLTSYVLHVIELVFYPGIHNIIDRVRWLPFDV